MKAIEKKQLSILREKYFEYKLLIRISFGTQSSQTVFSDYYSCMEFYCETYGYDLSAKCDSLERKWDSMFKKEHQ